MGLLDEIGSAQGGPVHNYLKGGRTVLKVTSVTFREATAKIPKPSFKIVGVILGSSNPKHAAEKGMSGTMNLGFKFAEQDLACARRCLRALLASKEGRSDVTEKEAAEKAKDLVGETQPLVGTVITIEAIEKPKKNSEGTFTQYEARVPDEEDLKLIEG